MNVVKIMGGLGNQLFQYAFAKSLERLGPVALDVSYYTSDFNKRDDIPHREYLLNFFADDLRYELQEDRKQVNQWEYDPKVKYENCFFFGDWQRASYFKGVDLGIKFKDHFMSDDVKALARQIRSGNSVSIHVRRTDYSKFNWLLDMSYYVRAVGEIEKCVEDPEFYIFSDDIPWCVANIPFHCREFVLKDELSDFWLMSQCKHNIIANSTFSFWAAYLNENPEKIVIYPSDWHINMNHPVDCLDWKGV